MKLTRSLFAAALLFVAPNIFASVNIFIQPQSQSVSLGSNAVFTASTTVTAGETITGYTWLTSTNSSGPFSTISGATGPVLSITNAQFSNSGFYFVRVNYQTGGSSGIAVSTAVTLSVQDQARITGQPASLTRGVGGAASFSVVAAGESPLGYQWRFQGVNLVNGGRISGANTATVTISNLTTNDAGNYDVVVTNNYSSAMSQSAVLTILVPPAITAPPTNQTVLVGSTLTLTGAAAGSAPLSYRWRRNGVNLSNTARISGVTTDTLIITNALTNDSGVYTLFVTNSVGFATSSGATISVLSPPSFTSATNAIGRQGAPFSFKMTASGSGPITFGSEELPIGLSLNPTNGQISGTPLVTGVFPVTVFASNAASNAIGTLTFTFTTGAPGIISPLTAQGRQGQLFNYNIFASNNPVSFSASEIPPGLSFDSDTGVISGVPTMPGDYLILIGATNQFGGDSKELLVTITTSAPVITSSLSVNGRQGQQFSYTLTASNNPASLSAIGVPASLSFNPTNGVISGLALESGLFTVTLTASNQFGFDTKVLLLHLISAAPVIRPPFTANGTENQPFTYTIQASNAPTSFNAIGLPVGLTLNPVTGVISGTPAIGGTNNVIISARNGWGVGTNVLQLRIAYVPVTSLHITDVTWTYSKPYLLDFTFSLRDHPDPAIGRAIARPIEQLRIVCKEGTTNPVQVITPIGNETAFIVSPAVTANAKQLKTFLVMDYTYSMLIAPGAIDAMESAVKGLIQQEPPAAKFAINEFHADFVPPALVQDFTSDKVLLSRAIDGIRTNFVNGNHAGSRLYDALSDAVAAFGAANTDEQRYIIVTSDGYDDGSVLIPQPGLSQVDTIVTAANNAGIQIYCVGFGANVNTPVLQQIAIGTGGRYFSAASANEIANQFSQLLKDLNSQYFLRWATLQRGAPFQPMFDVTVDNVTASYNTNFPTELVDETETPPVTNIVKIDMTTTPPTVYPLSAFAPDYNPADFAGNVQVGELRLVADAATNASAVTLRAFYVPRYVREFKVRYRANYPCTPMLLSTGPGEILSGWTMIETNDGTGTNGSWLTISCPDPSNPLMSLPYGIRGDLVKFQFQARALANPKQAFSLFQIDNSVYTNFPPAGQSFTLSTTEFITFYQGLPPYGTPIPWLISMGFTNNFEAAELTDPNGNGMPVWQEYLAGLNPNDPDATFAVSAIVVAQPGLPNQITFSTVVGKTYRVEAAVSLNNWLTLEDGIAGTGGEVTVFDSRNLSAASTMFYRIAVY